MAVFWVVKTRFQTTHQEIPAWFPTSTCFCVNFKDLKSMSSVRFTKSSYACPAEYKRSMNTNRIVDVHVIKIDDTELVGGPGPPRPEKYESQLG